MFTSMLIELTLFLIHQPPSLNFNFSIKINGLSTPYSLNMIITCASMVKVLIILRTFFRYSKWGEMSQIELDTLGLNKRKKQPLMGADPTDKDE